MILRFQSLPNKTRFHITTSIRRIITLKWPIWFIIPAKGQFNICSGDSYGSWSLFKLNLQCSYQWDILFFTCSKFSLSFGCFTIIECQGLESSLAIPPFVRSLKSREFRLTCLTHVYLGFVLGHSRRWEKFELNSHLPCVEHPYDELLSVKLTCALLSCEFYCRFVHLALIIVKDKTGDNQSKESHKNMKTLTASR